MTREYLEALLISNEKLLTKIKEDIRFYTFLKSEIEGRLEELEADLERLDNE